MYKFKVGDICIIHSIPEGNRHYKFNGEEVMIEALPGNSPAYPDCYKISGNIEDVAVSAECFLRLKRDDDINRADMDTIVRWEDCAWRPRVLEDVS